MKDHVTPLGTAAMLFAAVLLWSLPGQAAQRGPVVVELFTSQGCNSCPPADRLLGELTARDDVLPLSFHVTYWDRLGWPDTFGLAENTHRQRMYAEWLGLRDLYTPQMVIGGRIDVVGGARGRVLEAIDLLERHTRSGPDLTVAGDRLSVGAGGPDDAAIWLITFDDHHDVAIERGENRGRTLRYHHVVREITRLTDWHGEALELALPLAAIDAAGWAGAAILVQRLSDGALLAATRIALASG